MSRRTDIFHTRRFERAPACGCVFREQRALCLHGSLSLCSAPLLTESRSQLRWDLSLGPSSCELIVTFLCRLVWRGKETNATKRACVCLLQRKPIHTPRTAVADGGWLSGIATWWGASKSVQVVSDCVVCVRVLSRRVALTPVSPCAVCCRWE